LFVLAVQVLDQTLLACLLIVLENVNVHFGMKAKIYCALYSSRPPFFPLFFSPDVCFSDWKRIGLLPVGAVRIWLCTFSTTVSPCFDTSQVGLAIKILRSLLSFFFFSRFYFSIKFFCFKRTKNIRDRF